MTDNNEHDALGEFFRRRLEDHRMQVDANDWDEIERRLEKRKDKGVIWLWLGGATAAAAIAALLMIGNLMPDKAAETQQTASQAHATITRETAPAAIEQKITNMTITADNETETKIEPSANLAAAPANLSVIQPNDEELIKNEILIAATENEEYQPAEDMPAPALAAAEEETPKLDIFWLETKLEEDKTALKENKKWLLAAAFGFGGNNSDMSETQMVSPPQNLAANSGGNKYAASKSYNVRSFDYMRRDDFTSISHLPPLSVGLTARKNIGKRAGVETGLIYTNLTSRFEWSDWADFQARQALHYLGVPVNLAVYIWDSNPNWRIYISGGFTVEKGLQAIYKQERQRQSEHRVSTVRSSIDGLQWSLNSALGANFKIDKRWGIYFEPRVGYSFECDQPVSARTEWPLYFGINLGLNYEL